MTPTLALPDETAAEQQLGTVAETMTSQLVLLAADAPAMAALRRLVHQAIAGAPVVDQGRVVRVVTQRDRLVPALLDDPPARPWEPCRTTPIVWWAARFGSC